MIWPSGERILPGFGPSQFSLAAAVSVISLLLVASAEAQLPGAGTRPPPPTEITNVTESYHQGGILRVAVVTDKKTKLDRQSAVRLHCDAPLGTVWQTTSGASETTFLGLSVGKYDIQVSAVGYLSAHKEIEVAGLTDENRVEVILQRDPLAVNLDASGTADALMPPKASKETKHALEALKSGKLKDAQKQLDAAYKLVPANAQVNFLKGYLLFEQRN